MCWSFIPWKFPSERPFTDFVNISYRVDPVTGLSQVTDVKMKLDALQDGDLSWLPTTLDGVRRDHRYLKAGAAALYESPAVIDVRAGLIKAF